MLSISLLWIYVDLMYKWTENDNGNDKFWRKPALEPAVAGIYCWLVTNIQESKGIQETLVYFGLTRKVYVCIHSTFFWFHLALIFFFFFFATGVDLPPAGILCGQYRAQVCIEGRQ